MTNSRSTLLHVCPKCGTALTVNEYASLVRYNQLCCKQCGVRLTAERHWLSIVRMTLAMNLLVSIIYFQMPRDMNGASNILLYVNIMSLVLFVVAFSRLQPKGVQPKGGSFE